MPQPDLTVPEATPSEVLKSGWKTSEFSAVAGMIVTNVVAVLVMLGYVPTGDQASLTTAMTGIIGAAVAIITNAIVVWKYVQSRTEVKTTVANTQATLAMERLHVRIQSIQVEEGKCPCCEGG